MRRPLSDQACCKSRQRDWKGPPFEALAHTNPDRLITLITSNTLASHDLTFAAEAAGSIDTAAAINALLELIEHPSPLVREGAIYGLTAFRTQAQVRTKLEHLTTKDPSAGGRAAATEALED